MASDWTKRLRKHYETFWGHKAALVPWAGGPVRSVCPDFAAVRVDRNPKSIAVATVGMSMPDDEDPLELHVIVKAPLDDEGELSIAELLAATAHFHRTGARLQLGHTVDFGRPWLPGSACDHGLVSLPYFDGPELEWTADPQVQCLWLVPITKAEREYKKRDGLEALEELFDRAQPDLMDPARRSCV